MLIDILRMPPVFGLPIDRRRTIYSGDNPIINDPSALVWPYVPLFEDQLQVGSRIDITPTNIYKAVHIADNSEYVFETVFSMENEGAMCLYTKIIGTFSSQIAISVKAIQYYQQSTQRLHPLSHFMAYHDDNGPILGSNAALMETNPIHQLAPPVFGENQLHQFIDSMSNTAGSGLIDSRLAWSYRPIYTHIPHVMEALISGRFVKSPFGEIRQMYPMVELIRDQWFSYEALMYQMRARGITTYINHGAFDSSALRMMLMFPVKFTSQAKISDVLSRNINQSVSWNYADPYGVVLRSDRKFLRSADTLEDIFISCVMAYCHLHQYDYVEFLNKDDITSTVAIAKNAHDEIEITFTDHIHDQYVCFYSSFPALALATLSVGSGRE